MLFTRRQSHSNSASYSLRTSRYIDKEFQLKYSSVILSAAIVGILITIFPIYYFLNQNYEIFVELAYDQSPRILDYLEREKTWVTLLLVTGSSATLFFFWYLGLKLTSRIVGPIYIVRNHLQELARGNWSQAPIKIRTQDEFQELIECYNYFYESFRINLKKDLDLLQKFNIDPNNRDAYLAWKNLIEEKALQLNQTDLLIEKEISAVISSLPVEQPDQRHVS